MVVNDVKQRGESKMRKKEKERRKSKRWKGNEIPALVNMCHQCQRSDKRVVRCMKCTRKRYCVPCISKWYPNMKEEEFAEACPFCRDNCNCIACLRSPPKFCIDCLSPHPLELCHVKHTDEEKVQYSLFILQAVLPFVKSLEEEQMVERKIEATIQGVPVSEMALQEVECEFYQHLHCDNCETFLFDLHRKCPSCSYKLCVACCQLLRNGFLQEHKDELRMDNHTQVDEGVLSYCESKYRRMFPVKRSEWKSQEDGNIPCPPEKMGGCGSAILLLKCMKPVDWLSKLLEKVQNILDVYNSNVNFIHCPGSECNQPEDLQHFQWHWLKGEPVMVSNVLETTSGLSWEPMVMWRAFRQISKCEHAKVLDVNAYNCLDGREININIHKFFDGYSEVRFDSTGYPLLLKLEDWPHSNSLEEQLPRHFAEFISCLPFKEYTDPRRGRLNFAAKSSRSYGVPDMDPKMHIAYGLSQELGRGDSVINLHYSKSDTVNVLTHTASVSLTPEQLYKINLLKQKEQHGVELMEGGALWDIFRREDIPELEIYLNNHLMELSNIESHSLEQVVHPIHDQIFFLTTEHKMRLKEEFGIEPCSMLQQLGDAVLIPAGCPYQVRYLKSCTSVSLNFVSPESLSECIRLQSEYHVLPAKHRTKKDKLELEKIMLNALQEAVKELETVRDWKRPHQGFRFSGEDSLGGGSSEEACKVTKDDSINLNGHVVEEEVGKQQADEERLYSSSFEGELGASSDGVNLEKEQFDSRSPLVHGSSFGNSPHSIDSSPFIKVHPPIQHGLGDDQTLVTWHEHVVDEGVGQLLYDVERLYPHTFKGVVLRSEIIWLAYLKEFYNVIKSFSSTSVPLLTEEGVNGIREELHEFERIGFDLSWVHTRLEMVEELKFGNVPLVQEVTKLEKTLSRLRERLMQRQDEVSQAESALEEATREYDIVKRNRDGKVDEVANKYGAEFREVLTGYLGTGMFEDMDVEKSQFDAWSPSDTINSPWTFANSDGSPFFKGHPAIQHRLADDKKLVVWHGHIVEGDVRKLLDDVERLYPHTFKRVVLRSERIWSAYLQEFYSAVKSFKSTFVPLLTESGLTGIQENLQEFERIGFDLSWAHKRLKMVEELKFGNAPQLGELTEEDTILSCLTSKLMQRKGEVSQAKRALEEANKEYDIVKRNRDEKAEELAGKFGADCDQILSSHLGLGMLPGY